MSARTLDQRGFTLIEVMMVCALFLVVTGATLTAFGAFTTSHRRTEIQHDHAEDARRGLDVAARQLRNLANPTVNAITTIARATDYDFIFQTSDPAKTWVRYCLRTDAPASANQGQLWEVQSATPALPAGMDGPCPGTAAGASTTKTLVSGLISNQAKGADRNVFTYECAPGQPATCPATAAEYPRITNVGIDLFVDSNVSDNIRELRVSTGVFLRNQNEPPVAIATVDPATGSRKVIFNGSKSTDPESRTLQYYWFKGTAPTAANFTDCNASPTGALDEGVTLTYPFPASDASPQNFWLAVRDPGCLTDISPQIQVVIPA